MNNQKGKNNFNVIRLLAATLVMAGHMKILLGENTPEFLGHTLHGTGLLIFFLAGGYLITKSWMGNAKPLLYAIKRFFRIIPPLLLYVVLAVFVFGPILTNLPLKEYFFSSDTYRYLKNIFMITEYNLPGVFESNPYPNVVNGSLWSLPLEVGMYILVPIAVEVTCLRKNKRFSKPLFIACCLVCCLSRVTISIYMHDFSGNSGPTFLMSAVNLVPYYFIGAVYTLPQVKKLCNIQIATVLIILSFCFDYNYWFSEIIMYLILPYFIFSLAFDTPAYFSNKFNRLEVSYGVYLYGFFIQQVFVYICTLLNMNWGYNVYFIVTMIATFAIAYLSSKYIEKPCIKLSQKILDWVKIKTMC